MRERIEVRNFSSWKWLLGSWIALFVLVCFAYFALPAISMGAFTVAVLKGLTWLSNLAHLVGPAAIAVDLAFNAVASFLISFVVTGVAKLINETILQVPLPINEVMQPMLADQEEPQLAHDDRAREPALLQPAQPLYSAFSFVPDQVLGGNIFERLTFQDLGQVAQVSKRWNRLVGTAVQQKLQHEQEGAFWENPRDVVQIQHGQVRFDWDALVSPSGEVSYRNFNPTKLIGIEVQMQGRVVPANPRAKHCTIPLIRSFELDRREGVERLKMFDMLASLTELESVTLPIFPDMLSPRKLVSRLFSHFGWILNEFVEIKDRLVCLTAGRGSQRFNLLYPESGALGLQVTRCLRDILDESVIVSLKHVPGTNYMITQHDPRAPIDLCAPKKALRTPFRMLEVSDSEIRSVKSFSTPEREIPESFFRKSEIVCNNKRLAAASERGLHIWEIESGNYLGTIPFKNKGIQITKLNQDILIAYSDKKVEVYFNAKDMRSERSVPMKFRPAYYFPERLDHYCSTICKINSKQILVRSADGVCEIFNIGEFEKKSGNIKPINMFDFRDSAHLGNSVDCSVIHNGNKNYYILRQRGTSNQIFIFDRERNMCIGYINLNIGKLQLDSRGWGYIERCVPLALANGKLFVYYTNKIEIFDTINPQTYVLTNFRLPSAELKIVKKGDHMQQAPTIYQVSLVLDDYSTQFAIFLKHMLRTVCWNLDDDLQCPIQYCVSKDNKIFKLSGIPEEYLEDIKAFYQSFWARFARDEQAKLRIVEPEARAHIGLGM